MKLLFAEDDRDISKAVVTLLERSNYSVDAVFNGQDALDYALNGGYDAIILDIMMPKLDGIAALLRMRADGVTAPVMMLTAKGELEDRVTGFDCGADDYLPKPFEGKELLARVRALLRRREDYSPDLITFGDLTLDRNCCRLICCKKSIQLSGKAFQMAEMLILSPRRIISIDQFMERIWGWDCESEINVVWVNISFLRKKLLEIGSAAEIKATRGVGYSLEGF